MKHILSYFTIFFVNIIIFTDIHASLPPHHQRQLTTLSPSELGISPLSMPHHERQLTTLSPSELSNPSRTPSVNLEPRRESSALFETESYIKYLESCTKLMSTPKHTLLDEQDEYAQPTVLVESTAISMDNLNVSENAQDRRESASSNTSDASIIEHKDIAQNTDPRMQTERSRKTLYATTALTLSATAASVWGLVHKKQGQPKRFFPGAASLTSFAVSSAAGAATTAAGSLVLLYFGYRVKKTVSEFVHFNCNKEKDALTTELESTKKIYADKTIKDVGQLATRLTSLENYCTVLNAQTAKIKENTQQTHSELQTHKQVVGKKFSEHAKAINTLGLNTDQFHEHALKAFQNLEKLITNSKDDANYNELLQGLEKDIARSRMNSPVSERNSIASSAIAVDRGEPKVTSSSCCGCEPS